MNSLEQLSQLFGVDLSQVKGHVIEHRDYPAMVPGRVLNIDGDFLAYQVSADNEKPLEDMMHNHDVAVETLRLLAGAERAVSHLTCSTGDKGNRYKIAIQKEYQANRKGKEKPEHLHTIKNWMVRDRGAINHVHQEADDGLAQANVNAIRNGTPELSVLVSKDKDLQMVPGYHLDWTEGTIEIVDGFGHIELDRSKSSPKITGKGYAYFFCQLLTGDTADNIQGLPTLPGSVLNCVKPTAEITKAYDTLKSPTASPKQIEKAQRTIDERKAGPCGPVIAYEIMRRVSNCRTAFELVKRLYSSHGERIGFTHWETGEPVPWNEVLVSEAKLLWMRQTPDEYDVVNFFKKECV